MSANTHHTTDPEAAGSAPFEAPRRPPTLRDATVRSYLEALTKAQYWTHRMAVSDVRVWPKKEREAADAAFVEASEMLDELRTYVAKPEDVALLLEHVILGERAGTD